jgi:hypothetical protein
VKQQIAYPPAWNARRPWIAQTVNRCAFNGSLDQAQTLATGGAVIILEPPCYIFE